MRENEYLHKCVITDSTIQFSNPVNIPTNLTAVLRTTNLFFFVFNHFSLFVGVWLLIIFRHRHLSNAASSILWRLNSSFTHFSKVFLVFLLIFFLQLRYFVLFWHSFNIPKTAFSFSLLLQTYENLIMMQN